MPEAKRFPRLSLRGVKIVLQDLQPLAQRSWRERRDEVATAISLASTGGGRVSDERLDEIRARILEIATAQGFPGDTRSGRLEFDKRAAIAILDEDLVPVPEALRDDVWAFIAAVLLADVAWWRWGETSDRYRGGVRNAFQRLWLRATAFRRPGTQDCWELVETLSEDANLQILERPGVSASREVTRMIGEVWLEMSRERPALPMEGITRRAMQHLLVIEQVRPLHALDTVELHEAIREHFDRMRPLV